MTSGDSKERMSVKKVHLVVFIHGFEGTLHDFDNAERAFHRFQQLHGEALGLQEELVILKPKGNSGFAGTYDGIEKGAIRIWREVMEQIKTLGDRLAAMSIVGHSLGGLYARYMARLLNDCFVFETCEPRLFVTLATPHLSVRRPQNTPLNVVFQNVAQKVCLSAKELCMEDHLKFPLLHRMTEELYLDVLRKFKRRVAYANIANDFQVHYSTASISTFNPYNQDPSRTKRSIKYSDLTEWSLAMVQERMRPERPEDQEAFAKSDIRKVVLREMFSRLSTLGWERYDVLFPTVFAHEQIINKRSMFAGREVIRHLLNEVFFHAPLHVMATVNSPQRSLSSVRKLQAAAGEEARKPVSKDEEDEEATNAVVRLGDLYLSQI